MLKSGFRRIIANIMPPIARDFADYILNKRMFRKPRYSPKVYDSPEQIPLVADGVWDSANWLRHVEESLDRALKSTAVSIPQHDLGMAVSILAAHRPGHKISVVDIGGGGGLYYPYISSICSEAAFNYWVIDSQKNCDVGRQRLSESRNLYFLDSETEDLAAFLSNRTIQEDERLIINLSSTLQYILEWRDFLTFIAGFKADFICLTRFPAHSDAEQSAFAVQNIYTANGWCGSTPVVCFAEAEVVAHLRYLGYVLVSNRFAALNDTKYWDRGCSNDAYKRITLKSLVFCKLTANGPAADA